MYIHTYIHRSYTQLGFRTPAVAVHTIHDAVTKIRQRHTENQEPEQGLDNRQNANSRNSRSTRLPTHITLST